MKQQAKKSKQAIRSRRSVSNDLGGLQHTVIKAGLREAVLFLSFAVSLYLFVSLLTYDPLDPNWGSDSAAVQGVHNRGGFVGALFADVFFSWFGYFAYLFAFMVGHFGWLLYKGKHHDLLREPKHLIIPSLGFVLTLVSGCGLAIVHFAKESTLLPSHAGGVVGGWIGNGLESMISPVGATLLLLVIFFAGFTFMTGVSWLKIMDTLGYHTLDILPKIGTYLRTRAWPWLRYHGNKIWGFIAAGFDRASHYIGPLARERWQAFRARQEERRLQREADYEAYLAEQEEEDAAWEREEAQARRVASPPPQATPVPPASAPAAEPEEPKAKPEPEAAMARISDTAIQETVTPVDGALEEKLNAAIAQLNQKLDARAELKQLQQGPVLTRAEILPDPNPLKFSQVARMAGDLVELLNLPGVRLLESQQGLIQLEIPNPRREPIALNGLLLTKIYQESRSPLTQVLGKDSSGHPVVVDLARMPHLLIGGSDAGDVERAIHNSLISLLNKATPDQLRLILLDSRHQTLAPYENLPHLLTPLLSDSQHHTQQVVQLFSWCVKEMDRRYRLMADIGVRNIDGYNQKVEASRIQESPEGIPVRLSPISYVVMLVDELEEITLNNPQAQAIEELITRLAQKSRAAGIHMILATRNPSVNVVTGLMRTNFPSRIAFQVNDKNESRNLLGQEGAENLLGEGDMYYLTPGTAIPARIHAAYIAAADRQAMLDDLRQTHGKPEYEELGKQAESHLSYEH